MYIIELLIKKFFKKSGTNIKNSSTESYEDEYEKCEHIFMPIDSTNETLACRNCGLIKKRSELKNKNFFIQEK